jgi:transposase
MVEPRASEAAGSERDLRRLTMRMPDEVAVMLELKRRGWGVRKIAAEFGACPKTVRAWIKAGGWRGYKRPGRPKKLDGLSDWLEAKMIQHRGNADVVRQDLKEELAIEATLRTVERAVAPLRQRLEAERRAGLLQKQSPAPELQSEKTK